ncbi:TPA: hypothetical protein ACIVQF_005438, partial [Salmonella enterica subsp. enterica serovar Muenchen]
MRYFLFMFIMIEGLLSFSVLASQVKNTSPKDIPAPQQCTARHELTDTTMTHYWQAGTSYYAYYQGCEYVSFHASDAICIESSSGYYCNWKPTGKVEPSDSNPDSGDSGDSGTPDTNSDNPDIKPDKPDDKPDTGGGSVDGSSSGSSTPSLVEPEKPYPDNASIGQLRDSYLKCTEDLSKLPSSHLDN